MIARWPGRITAGTTTDHVSAFWDVMPTLADLLDTEVTTPTDGISFLPVLLGDTANQQQHKSLYWEFHEQGGRTGVRAGDWKLVQYNAWSDPPGAVQLYNLRNDESEENNVAEEFPEKVNELKTVMASQRTPSPVFD